MLHLSVSGQGTNWHFESLLTLRSIVPSYHTLDLVLCTMQDVQRVPPKVWGGAMEDGDCRMAADRRSACAYPLA